MSLEDPEFLKVRGLSRLRHLSRLDIISNLIGIVAAIISMAFGLISTFPQLHKLLQSWGIFSTEGPAPLSFIISSAYAATEAGVPSTFDPRPIINLLIVVVIGISFIWTLGVTLHSNNARRVKTAGDLAKLFVGFLLGSAKSYLGLG